MPYIKDMMKNGRDFRILELDKSVLKENEEITQIFAYDERILQEFFDNGILLIVTGSTSNRR